MAVDNYLQAIKVNPSFAAGYYQLGFIYHTLLDDQENAVNYFKKTVNYDPSNFNAYVFLGDIEFSNKRYDQALIYYQKAVKVNDKAAEPFYKLGLIYEERQNENTAFNYFMRVIQINDKHEKAHYKIGKYYDEKGNKDLAIDYYKKVEKINGENIEVLYKIGAAYFKLDKFDLAKAYLQRYLKIVKTNNDAKILFARILEMEGKIHEQIELLQSITDKDQNKEVYLMLAKAYGKVENTEMEKEYYIQLSRLGSYEATIWLKKNNISIS